MNDSVSTAGRGSTPKKGKSTGEVQIDPEANSHIKEALEVCALFSCINNVRVLQ